MVFRSRLDLVHGYATGIIVMAMHKGDAIHACWLSTIFAQQADIQPRIPSTSHDGVPTSTRISCASPTSAVIHIQRQHPVIR